MKGRSAFFLVAKSAQSKSPALAEYIRERPPRGFRPGTPDWELEIWMWKEEKPGG